MDNALNILMGMAGGYVLASLFVLKYPSLLHTRKKVKFCPRHISHRGGAGENYENTLTAFERAVESGTDMLELDCQLTLDGKVVVSHDNNLLRCAGVDKNITDFNYKDLPMLKSEIPIDFDPGVTFRGSGEEQERRIPLLEDVFKRFPNVPMNIDVKTNSDTLVQEVDRLIREYKREDITVWGNYTEEITNKCYKQNPNIHLLFSLKKVVRLILYFYTGLLPFLPIKESHLEIFLPSMYLQPVWKQQRKRKEVPFIVDLPTFLVRFVDFLVMSRSLFKHLADRGIQTYVWVLNEESDFKKVFDLGVTGIMTDYPSRLHSFLKQNPQYAANSKPQPT